MTLSDLITFVGLTLAIIAFLNEEERSFIINKFTRFNKLILVFVFLFINYLLFYSWFRTVLPCITDCEFENLPKASTWAYIITLISIVWILLKILVCKFPQKNYLRLIKYFQNLQNRKEYARIYTLLTKYNNNDIQNYLLNKKNKFNIFVFEEILNNQNFLKATSSFNISLINKLYENTDNIPQTFFERFLYTQLNTKQSYLNTNIKDSDKLQTLYISSKKTGNFSECIFDNIEKNITPIMTLHDFIFNIYKYQLKSINDKIYINEINSVIYHEIKKLQNPVFLKKYFENFFSLLDSATIHVESFELLYNDLVRLMIINYKEYKNDNCINELLISKSIMFYNIERLRNIVRKSLTENIKSVEFKSFRKSIYDSWKLNFKGKNSEFDSEIIEKISNY